jgi:hypothetical protein
MLHIPKVLYLVEVQASVSEQRNSHTDLTGDQTQGPLKEIPMSYPETTRSEINIFLAVITGTGHT